MKNDMWAIIILVSLCLTLGISLAVEDNNRNNTFKKEITTKDIITYIKEHDPDNTGHILTNIDYGSQLLYYGLNNIFCDTRPEMLNEKINNQENTMELIPLFRLNTEPETLEVKNIKDALEHYDIKFIIDYKHSPVYNALDTYLEYTDDYKIIEFPTPDEEETLVLYERVTERTE